MGFGRCGERDAKTPTFVSARGGCTLGFQPRALLDVSVEDEEHPGVLPGVEALERVLVAVARDELDASGNRAPALGHGLPRRLGALGERRAHDADGLEDVLHGSRSLG